MFFDFGIRWKKGKPQHTFQVNYYKSLAPWLREKNPQNDISCVEFELKKRFIPSSLDFMENSINLVTP